MGRDNDARDCAKTKSKPPQQMGRDIEARDCAKTALLAPLWTLGESFDVVGSVATGY